MIRICLRDVYRARSYCDVYVMFTDQSSARDVYGQRDVYDVRSTGQSDQRPAGAGAWPVHWPVRSDIGQRDPPTGPFLYAAGAALGASFRLELPKRRHRRRVRVPVPLWAPPC